jgi:glycine dehydrogenase subunit 1
MRYLPKSPGERLEMLKQIGAGSIDDLFSTIPQEYRLERDLEVPRQMGESEIVDYFRNAAQNSAAGYTSFLGAGAYRHYRPVIIDSLVQRGEFLTSYTPYQAEITQGTLQAIFEFQTMICELTGMEIANASMHPEYREVMQTYAQHQGLAAQALPFGEDGRLDLAALEQSVSEETACVLIQSPNFFGVVEDIPAISQIVHQKGALLIVSIAEAISLGVVRPPAEADIVSIEAQSFGVALSYGGPYCGVIAAKEKYLRQMPGRLVGETVDTEGRRGFVLTLSTREQHIRREKATSNICTNQALVALMATIFLTVYGKEGIRELALHNLAKANYAAEQFAAVGGARLLFAASPRFHEFVLETSESPEQLNAQLLKQKVIGGLPLGRWYPELGNASLWCTTELNTREQIDHAASLLQHDSEAAFTRA